ncbi:hypothetical protein QE152_g22971 [Popillia japonica]|uniref:Maturase K n=1 Tax=Popillia japonica TaxID=7064 RepID=A0AAW1KIW1_POPJA
MHDSYILNRERFNILLAFLINAPQSIIFSISRQPNCRANTCSGKDLLLDFTSWEHQGGISKDSIIKISHILNQCKCFFLLIRLWI